MLISIVERRALPSTSKPHTFVLRRDNWDDFGFSTLFDLHYFDEARQRVELGGVKIMRRGQKTGGHADFPDSPFKRLDDSYCSVGQGQSYYEAVYNLPQDLRERFLAAIKDCAFNLDIFRSFEEEEAFHTSLLRSVRKSDIPRLFRSILLGNIAQTAYDFSFRASTNPETGIDVKVEPHSLPPTNIHVLIGRNGVGKTRLLSGIVDQLTGRLPESISVVGEVVFPNLGQDDERFTSLVSVAFSAFDQFKPVKNDQIAGRVRYAYIGLKKEVESSKDDTDEAVTSRKDKYKELKSLMELEAEFSASFENCMLPPRLERWNNAIASLNSDPIFAELELDQISGADNAVSKMTEIFGYLSSGHKLILLTITRLVELVEEKTLVLIDEPETHLHPPLLASFTNALSDLMVNRNGVALIATHSPVVLQEVPASCVTIVDRSGQDFSFHRPELETYGENVGTLTREVFNLEVLESGFHQRIKKELEASGYENLLAKFGGQIGSEGRALARVLNSQKRDL